MPDPAYLRDQFHYEPDTGRLFWKACPTKPAWRNTCLAGKEAGYVDATGYRRINLDGAMTQAHRIAYAIAHGVWPEGEIDHIDHNRTNNRVENLRVVDRADNARNLSRRENNTSGVVGVSWVNKHHRWHAYISIGKRRVHLGYFTDRDAAIAARKAAELEHDYHPNHGAL